MKNWLIGLLASPLLPILVQTYKVLLAVENTLNDILKAVTDLGIPVDTPIFDSVKTVITAVIAVKIAIVNTIEFLGGSISIESQIEAMNLKEEIEKLKKTL